MRNGAPSGGMLGNINKRIICGSSFAMPALAIKCDAYPGRLNQVSVLINREGVFYGQKAAR